MKLKIKAVKVMEGEIPFYHLSFSYNQEIIQFIKEQSYRVWNPEKKIWILSEESFKDFQTNLDKTKFQIIGEHKDLTTIYEVKKEKIKTTSDLFVKNQQTTYQLFNHQKEFLSYAVNNKKFILGDEQGLGKTAQIISLATARKKVYKDKHCLIIVGINGLKYNWKEEIEKFTKEDAYIIGERVRKKSGKTYIGSNKEKLEDISNLKKLPKAFFWIINVESLRYKEGKGRGNYVLANQLAKLCQLGVINMVAFDEMHKSKNYRSKQTRALLKIKAECQIAATGTLITNNPLDAYIPLHWLGIIPHNYENFKNTYAIMGGWNNLEVVGYQNLDHLNGIINNYMIRRKKEEVLDLPEKTPYNEYVILNKEEKKYYNQILNETIESLKKDLKKDKNLNVSNVLSKFIALRQVTGHANILFENFQNSSKFERCLEIVEEKVKNNEKVVIFSQWTSITNRLLPLLSHYNPVSITGETSMEEREIAKKKFQQDNSCKVIVGTTGAMGTGHTLTAGSTVIFLDSPWTYALKQQCEDRCHRIGTKGTVNIITLIAKNTIDEYIEKIIYAKQYLSKVVVEEVEEEGENIQVMLDWLLSSVKEME